MGSAFERIGHERTLDKMSEVPLILIAVGYVAMSGALFWSFASPKEASGQPVERIVLPAEAISPCPHSGELASCDVGDSDS